MDSAELLERLEREPPERWPLIAQQRIFHTPGFAEALIERAVAHRSKPGGLVLAYSQTAVVVAARLSRRFQHLHARALAELGNAYRSEESYDLAAEKLQEAEFLLDDHTPLAVKGELLSFKASLLRDQRMFHAAVGTAELAVSTFANTGQVLDEARNVVKLGHIYSQARRSQQAKRTFDRALQLLLREDQLQREIQSGPPELRSRYLALVATVQVNACLIGVEEAEAEADPETRARIVESTLYSIWRMKTSVTEALPPHESLHLDWMWGRLMIVDGKFAAAIQILELVRDRFSEEGLAVRSADAGEDLLFAYVAQGDLKQANREAQRMLAIYEQHELLPDQLAVLEAMSNVRQRYQAACLLRREHGPTLLATPRRPRGIPL